MKNTNTKRPDRKPVIDFIKSKQDEINKLGSFSEYYNDKKLTLKKGDSMFIPAIVKEYSIKGNAFLYKAAIP